MDRRWTGDVARSSPLLQQQPSYHRGRRRPWHDEFNNNPTTAGNNNNDCSTTLLVDELEQLRTDNFQLRLRVYNAERRVDRLSAASCRRDTKCDSNSSGSDTDASSGTTTTDDDDAENTNARAAAAAATATAAAAVRTIHDLLTVNRRLLALLASAVSAKAVAVTADDKRRWRQLRDRVNDDFGTGLRDEREPEQRNDNDELDGSTDSETCATKIGTFTGREVVPPQAPPTPPPETGSAEDGGELSRLRGRCRRLERSLQQLVNTELWARNRQIGKLEQQRYVTQQQQQQQQQQEATDRELRQQSSCPTTTSPPIATKGILVIRTPAKTRPTTPPPVLPDYSEVNFFSCDEEDEHDSETNTWSSAAAEEERTDNSDAANGVCDAEVARAVDSSATSAPRKRPCKRHRRQRRGRPGTVAGVAATTSSSTQSTADLTDDGCVTTATMSSATVSRSRSINGGPGGDTRRRRKRRYGRCSTCGRRGGVSGTTQPPPVEAVADAQVQCERVATDDGDDDEDDDAQVTLLRAELDSRRRENRRLYEMLLRLQREKGREGHGAKADSLPRDRDVDSDPDRTGSPEPYRRAARAMRGRIADLLPPLLSERPAVTGDDAPATVAEDDGMDRQQRQQLQLLARLRERIVAYERQELYGDGRETTTETNRAVTDEDAVRRMDRTALVNVALPRAVDRLRRALMPLLHQQRPNEAHVTADCPLPPSDAS